MKNLIIYFSHSGENYFKGSIVNIKQGNTKVLCEKLQKILDADCFELEPVVAYPTIYGECTQKAKEELNALAKVEYKGQVNHLEEYENIYIAYPNWWGTYPRIIATFIEKNDLSHKHIYPICTHEGSGMGRSENDLRKALSNSIVHKGLAVNGSSVYSCDELLRKYIGRK